MRLRSKGWVVALGLLALFDLAIISSSGFSARLVNCALDLDVGKLIDAGFIKRIRQRQRAVASIGFQRLLQRVVETDNESYRLQHSTLAAQTKIKSRERKRKGEDGIEDDEPF